MLLVNLDKFSYVVTIHHEGLWDFLVLLVQASKPSRWCQETGEGKEQKSGGGRCKKYVIKKTAVLGRPEQSKPKKHELRAVSGPWVWTENRQQLAWCKQSASLLRGRCPSKGAGFHEEQRLPAQWDAIRPSVVQQHAMGMPEDCGLLHPSLCCLPASQQPSRISPLQLSVVFPSSQGLWNSALPRNTSGPCSLCELPLQENRRTEGKLQSNSEEPEEPGCWGEKHHLQVV